MFVLSEIWLDFKVTQLRHFGPFLGTHSVSPVSSFENFTLYYYDISCPYMFLKLDLVISSMSIGYVATPVMK